MLDKLTELYIHADNNNIEVVDYAFKSTNIKGLYCDNVIALNKDLQDTEKACILAEELGHYYTSVGNILDQHNLNNQKQEYIARRWATNALLCPSDLIKACIAGNEYISDAAEYLGVTSEFLIESIKVFIAQYGLIYRDGDYEIVFNEQGYNVHSIKDVSN